MHSRGAVNETNSLDGPALSVAVPCGILRSDESGFYGFAPPEYKLVTFRLHTICV